MKINQLIRSKLNSRREYPPELITDLVDSIKLDGLISKLVLRPVGDKFEVLAGWRRKLALEDLEGSEWDLPKDWYIVKDVTDYEAVRLSITENVQRLNFSSLELADAAESLIANKPGIKPKEIARILWSTEARVKRLLKLSDHTDDLPDQAIQELATPDELDPTFSDAHVEAMSKAGAFSMGDEVIRDVCEVIMDNDIPASKVAATVERFAPKEDAVPASADSKGEGEGSKEDEAMQDRFNGRLKYDGGTLVVESKKETIPLDLAYYDEFLRDEQKFSVFVNAKVNIKTIGE